MTPNRFISFSLIFTTVSVQHFCASVNLNTLKLVQVVYRHGDRAPLTTYPNDPYSDIEKYWPMGLSQLTNRGKDQQYDLGQYLRQRYDGFLHKLYTKKQIHVLSSDTDRTLMSAEANLEGLFPKLTAFSGDSGMSANEPKGKVDRQLVPIHTLMEKTDKILKMHASCPRMKAALAEYKNSSPLIQRLQEENKELVKYVREKTGLSYVTDLFSLLTFSDPLYCQQQHNLSPPSWVNSTVFEKIRYLNAIEFSLTGGTPELRRLHGGPLVQRLLSNMEEKIFWKKNRPKMYMHSAHDSTLAAVMNTMGVFDPQIPGYASVFIVDLHQEEPTGKYFVEIFYRNTTEREPYPLQIPGCGSPCYLNDMVSILTPFIPTNWEEECQLQTLTYSGSQSEQIVEQTGFTALLYFLAVILTIVIVWGTIFFFASKRRNSRNKDNDRPGDDKESYVKIP